MIFHLNKFVSITLFFLILPARLFAQYPASFIYDSENGLPSNEVYSIVRDKKGFLWIGCDAGLYKFDGIRYRGYKSPAQKSKSISGLNLAPSGKIYCFNFQSQLFFLENDTLRLLKHSYESINGISIGLNGNVYISHNKGLACYNENSATWENYSDFRPGTNSLSQSPQKGPGNEVYFLTEAGIGNITNGKVNIIRTDIFDKNQPGTFILIPVKDEIWIFSRDQNLVYKVKNGVVNKTNNETLLTLLYNRKITNVKNFGDNQLWICTYNGLIVHDIIENKSDLLYKKYAFSDIVPDGNSGYWASTLQSGILRIPKMDYLIWNSDNSFIPGNEITGICGDGSFVYFSTINGTVGKINTENNELTSFHSGSNADIQCIQYIPEDKNLLVFINHNLLSLKKNSFSTVKKDLPPLKFIKRINEEYITATSFGCYTYSSDTFECIDTLTNNWSRDIKSGDNNTLYIATNNGLLQFRRQKNQWHSQKKFLDNTQILSIDNDSISKQLFILSFDGRIFCITDNNKISILSQIPDEAQGYKLKYRQNKIYIVTNKGLYIYHIETGSWIEINKLSGLASSNVRDLYILNDAIWLATGKGLQKIPVTLRENTSRSTIYLRSLSINGKTVNTTSFLNIQYGDQLTIFPEANNYYSNGNYQYAYRIKHLDSNWIFLPADINYIEVKNIPAGEFKIEVKLVDHLGINSDNFIVIKGNVQPPFWETFWFYGIAGIVFFILVYLVFTFRMQRLRKKQAIQIDRINLENELQLTQQTALKAQMNPHFIFNVLNSIKGYIYKNDKLNASQYLSDFSDLIRTILNMSSQPYVSLRDELNMLELYIGLEAMLLQKDFTHSIETDDEIDSNQIKIPSLILQPFVENAFKHGLRHSEKQKDLKILIKQKNKNTLLIQITDNGIGRNASKIINQKYEDSHSSFAVNSIARRTELINREGKQHMNINIVDLSDISGKPSGTQINITLHYHA